MEIDEKTKKRIVEAVVVPLVAYIIFIIPIINQAIQIDIAQTDSIPLHWAMVISAAVGGAMSSIVLVLKILFKSKEIEINERAEVLRKENDGKVADLQVKYDQLVDQSQKDIKILELERDISERDIMLNSSCLNEKWLLKNTTIDDLERIIALKKQPEVQEPIQE